MKHPLSNNLEHILASANLLRPHAAWRPAADVYRCEHGWLIKFDLAGVRQEDITIQVQGSKVIVTGTRRDWRLFQRQETHLMEIAYSHFERAVELPEATVMTAIQSEYRDGMLLVHVLAGTESHG